MCFQLVDDLLALPSVAQIPVEDLPWEGGYPH
jgi:hypothetical protein